MQHSPDVQQFERIVDSAGKQHLGLRAALASRSNRWCALVVSGPKAAIAYQCRGPWEHQFRRDLEEGRFG